MVSNVELALAEALLAAGEAGAARDAALRAHEIAARAGRVESAWRALAVAGMASRSAGDAGDARTHLSRANELFAQLRRDWGEQALSNYLTRPDLRSLLKELDGLKTAALRP
jgi:hypothetical protein